MNITLISYRCSAVIRTLPHFQRIYWLPFIKGLVQFSYTIKIKQQHKGETIIIHACVG